MPDSNPMLFVNSEPVDDFRAVESARDAGRLRTLGVECFGRFAEVDLDSGTLSFEGDTVSSVARGDLRPVYYMRRFCEVFPRVGDTETEFIALGWQATVDGVNVRLGVRLYPDGVYEVTEDI
jgi:hypothetical protein